MMFGIDERGQHRFGSTHRSVDGGLSDLLECALLGRLIGPPAEEFGTVSEAIVGDVIETHLRHKLRTYRLPLPTSLRAPPARAARRLAGKAGRLSQRLQPLRQRAPVVIGDGRREPNVIELARIIVESEQERPDLPAIAQVAKSTDHAVGSAEALHLDHRAFARSVGIGEQLCDDAVC